MGGRRSHADTVALEEEWLKVYEARPDLSAPQVSKLLETGSPVNWHSRSDRRSPWFIERWKRLEIFREDPKDPDQFPDMLTFRERHFAYEDPRVIHPATQLATVRRAVNNWFQIDANRRLEETNRAIIVLPPGHIKTTFFAIERPVRNIMRDRNYRMTVVQKNQDEASKLVTAVQERLACDFYHNLAERLERQGDEPIICPVCLYGPFKPERAKQSGEKWGAYGFRVTGRTSGEKDDTYQAKGVGGQIQGVRADEIILDDVQDPMVATVSPADSMQKLDWMKKVIVGRVYPHQKIVVLANFFAPDDLAHKVIEHFEDWAVTNYPAILDEENRQVLCPEVWDFDGLMQKKKEVGPEVWHFTWMQDESSAESATFKREAIDQCKDPELSLGAVPYAVDDLFLGVDPAAAAAGHCAMVVWGLDRSSKQRYLIDVFNEKGMRNWRNVTDQILEFCRTYEIRRAIVEGNNTQKAGLTEDPYFQREMRALGTKYDIYQTVTGSGARAVASNYDITTIGALFDGGLITVPYGGTAAQNAKVDAWVDQLCAWRTDEEGRSIKHLKRDMVMATLFAESEAFVLANRRTEKPRQNRSRVPRWAMHKDGSFRRGLDLRR